VSQPTYPRSPKVLLGGIAHLGRFIDKIRLRHVGQNEAPRSKLRGITELNSEDFSEGEANPVASYGECQVQDYNYITVGFDKYLADFLSIDAKAFEQRVLVGGTDEELLAWVKANSRKPSDQEIAQWSQELLVSGPKDAAGRRRFQGRWRILLSSVEWPWVLCRLLRPGLT